VLITIFTGHLHVGEFRVHAYRALPDLPDPTEGFRSFLEINCVQPLDIGREKSDYR